VRRDVRGALSRWRRDLRLAAAERYREAVRTDSRQLSAFRIAAAAVDSAAAVRRAVRVGPARRTAAARAVLAATGRDRNRDVLVVAAVAVSGAGELSLSLAGPADRCAEPRAIALAPTGGGPLAPLETTAVAHDRCAALVAVLPPEKFADELTTWRVVVTDGAQELPVVATADALAQRCGVRAFAALGWPPRLGLSADQALVVEGRAAATDARVAHTISLGVTSAVVTWQDDGPAGLQLVSRHDETAVVVTGHPHAGGQRTATVDLRVLVAQPAAVWDANIGTVDDWSPLRLPVDEYPVANRLPVSDQRVPVRRADGRTVAVRLGYSDTNVLGIRVGDR